MSVLVTGGAGYIGSHAVKMLVESGEDVVVVDSLVTGFRQAVAKAARFYQGDIRDRAFLHSVFDRERIEAVIHFAASSVVNESVRNPLKYYDNNIYGTKVLLGAMIDAGVEAIVFSSTAAVYGEPQRVPILETDLTLPTNPYGDTKRAMEKMIHWTGEAHDLRYVSLRYFNASGADAAGAIGEAHDPETHLIPLILQTALGQRDTISVFGTDYDTKDGTCVRDYIHVTDLASAHVLAMRYLLEGQDSEIFNLGNGVGFTVREVIETARKVTGQAIPARDEARRAGDPAQLIASSDKARAVLGWDPQHDSLTEIIESAWRFAKNHPNGYEVSAPSGR